MRFQFEGLKSEIEIKFNFMLYSEFIQVIEPSEDEIIVIPEKFSKYQVDIFKELLEKIQDELTKKYNEFMLSNETIKKMYYDELGKRIETICELDMIEKIELDIEDIDIFNSVVIKPMIDFFKIHPLIIEGILKMTSETLYYISETIEIFNMKGKTRILKIFNNERDAKIYQKYLILKIFDGSLSDIPKLNIHMLYDLEINEKDSKILIKEKPSNPIILINSFTKKIFKKEDETITEFKEDKTEDMTEYTYKESVSKLDVRDKSFYKVFEKYMDKESEYIDKESVSGFGFNVPDKYLFYKVLMENSFIDRENSLIIQEFYIPLKYDLSIIKELIKFSDEPVSQSRLNRIITIKIKEVNKNKISSEFIEKHPESLYEIVWNI